MSELNLVKATIVGDGHITPTGQIRFHHSSSQIKWVEEKIKILNNSGIKTGDIKKINRLSYGENRDFVNVRSRKPSTTKYLRKLFYPENKKIIPEEFLNYFNFEMLAIIYQDDGRQNVLRHTNNLIKGERIRVETQPFVNRYELCLESFDEKSLLIFQECLLNLGIESRICKRNRINISRADSKVAFYNGIKNFVIEDMKYKISAMPTLSYEQ